MPPKAVPKKRVALLRRRFRKLIEWAFDENLSLAARALGMPVSTVQQYYQAGPRRISKKALRRIDELTGLGEWMAGDDDREIWRRMDFITIQQKEGGPKYLIPKLVLWRVKRVIDEMEKHATADRDVLREVFFAPILEALSAGLFPSLSAGSESNYALLRQAEPRRLRSAVDIQDLMGMNIERAKQIHRLCKWWEGELRLVIKAETRRLR